MAVQWCRMMPCWVRIKFRAASAVLASPRMFAGSDPAVVPCMTRPSDGPVNVSIRQTGKNRWSVTVYSAAHSITIESDSREDLVEHARIAQLLLDDPAIGM